MTRRRRRLPRRPPLVLGLTGSIGMGKSSAGRMLRRLGLPVHDADEAVHELLGPGGGAVAAVEAAFPGVNTGAGIDRDKLGARVFADAAALRRLEAILHPAARAATRRFLRRQAHRRQPLAVLDIPLLFETGGERLCDAVVVVTAPPFVQQARVLARPDMTPARWRAVQARQMPDRDKRRRADFVVHTGLSRRHTLRQLAAIVRLLRRRRQPARPRTRNRRS
ncbi:MAG TPA: dephospho-CoA kinase [Kiloniellales bacterium]